MAQILLASPLCTASRSARSPFFKSEAFRLLTPLVGRTIKDSAGDHSDVEKKGLDAMSECCNSFVKSLYEAVQDTEMKKAKRVRDVLKTTEKLLEFLEKTSLDMTENLESLVALNDAILKLQTESESKGVTSLCGSINNKLASFIEEVKAKVENKSNSAQASTDPKKKKSSKKKRGKKK